jgi:hypothetical protein
MDEKELALAVNFSKAPADVQAAVTAHYQSIKKINKLKGQLVQISADLAAAEDASGKTARTLRDAMNNWKLEA